MQATAIKTQKMTMPWGGGHTYSKEQKEIAQEVRREIQDAYSTARDTLSRSEKWKPGWTFDLDPSPNRVERTSDEYGEHRSVIAATSNPESQFHPPSYLRTEDNDSSLEAKWDDGKLTFLKSTLDSDIGTAELTIEINPETGTLTYHSTKTGEFAKERQQVSGGPGGSGSSESDYGHVGPDGVYNEWDNSNRGGGPDAIYNEWDNGRGSYYDGPDGRYYYDPY